MSRAEMLSHKRFREWCATARQLWPLDKPVRIRRVRKLDCCAECDDRGDFYTIKIALSLDRQATSDALVHEWCHLRRHEIEDDPEGLHDETFWIMFGEMWRAWIRQ